MRAGELSGMVFDFKEEEKNRPTQGNKLTTPSSSQVGAIVGHLRAIRLRIVH